MKTKTILIVDDDKGHCRNLEDILELEGYAPFTAHSLAEGKEQAKKRRPQVALLDLKLPDGSGTELLGILKRRYPECYCIIITAHADLDSAVTALDEGAYHYFRKPLRPTELIGLLNRVFEAIRLRDENKRAEKALRESEEKLAGIINAVADAVIMVDEHNEIHWTNDCGRKVFGEELAEMKYYKVLYGKDEPAEDCIIRSCFSDGRQHDMEIKIETADGKSQDFWCTTSVGLRNEDGKPRRVVMVCRNITEKKRLQAEVLRNAHLAALGELAAGVAHEINNPTNCIINYAQILIDQEAQQGHDAEIPKRIYKEGDRIAVIVSKLLSFARDRTDKMERVAVPDILEEALDLTRAMLRKRSIRIEINTGENLPFAWANYQQIQQVFLNIISNAWYALNQKYSSADPGKRLEISCERVESEGIEMIRTAFLDHGMGISSKNLYKACNPFFSTKPADKGTGLGLSISHGLVEDHGGKLWMESTEGEFTRVVVDLPAHREAK